MLCHVSALLSTLEGGCAGVPISLMLTDRIKGCDGACIHAVDSLAGADGWSITNVAAFPISRDPALLFFSGLSPLGGTSLGEPV